MKKAFGHPEHITSRWHQSNGATLSTGERRQQLAGFVGGEFPAAFEVGDMGSHQFAGNIDDIRHKRRITTDALPALEVVGAYVGSQWAPWRQGPQPATADRQPHPGNRLRRR